MHPKRLLSELIEAGNEMRVQLLSLATDYKDAMARKGGVNELHPCHSEAIDAWDKKVSALPSCSENLTLTEDQYRAISNRILEEHRKYADTLLPEQWAEIAARKAVSQLLEFDIAPNAIEAGNNLRDQYMRLQAFAIAHLPARALERMVNEFSPKAHVDAWDNATNKI